MGKYFDVLSSGTPRLEDRWQVFICNGQPYDVFFYGCCLVCSRTLWATADGTTLKQMERHELVVLTDEEGREFRLCGYCAFTDHRVKQAVTLVSELLERGDDPGPLRWPANHPEQKGTKR
jgi:hypothetical protein